MGTYCDSSHQDLTASINWSTSQDTVATISSTGLATAVAGGTTMIAATLGAVTMSTRLSVHSQPVARLCLFLGHSRVASKGSELRPVGIIRRPRRVRNQYRGRQRSAVYAGPRRFLSVGEAAEMLGRRRSSL